MPVAHSLRAHPHSLVFLFALACRLAFWLLADQPLLYTHQYHYFANALRIATHPAPVDFVLQSDEWRTWDGHWTIAPLYHLFLAAMLRVSDASLAAVRAVQCVLEAAVAALASLLGRRVAGRHGMWAGVAYAVYWPAVEMPTWTMTENLHTVLLVAGVAMATARPPEGAARRQALAAGLVLGLSALTRSVTTGLIGLLVFWRAWTDRGRPRGILPAALLATGAALVVLPWTARNVLIVGDAVLIESAAFENLWWANHFTDKVRYRRQEEVIHAQATPADKRRVALHFALRGIRRSPDQFIQKVRTNFWHFLRPEGLHTVLGVQRSLEPWRLVGTLVLDDALLLTAIPLFAVFLVAAPPSPVRSAIMLWTAYYLLMIVVVFHNEIRYRSALLPFVFVGAAGGLAVLADPLAQRRTRVWIAFAMGAALSAASAWPYAAPAARAVRARLATSSATTAARAGDAASALRLATAAAARDPRSPRPWLDLAHALGTSERGPEAALVYAVARPLTNFANWRPPLGLARHAGGAAAAAALRDVDRLSFDADPWLMLEVAWRELPAPRTDEIQLARGDYGAVRGFLHPRGLDPSVSAHRLEWSRYEPPGPAPPPGPHRWTRSRAWVRLQPTTIAQAYEVTVEMGSPFPSPLARPVVSVRVGDGEWQRIALDPAITPYTVRGRAAAGAPLLIEIRSPTWSRLGEPTDQGVRVDRVRVRPAR